MVGINESREKLLEMTINILFDNHVIHDNSKFQANLINRNLLFNLLKIVNFSTHANLCYLTLQ